MRNSVAALVLTWAASLGACELPFDQECHTEVRYAIEAEVRDARTGEPAAQGATGWVRDGTFADTMQLAGGFQIAPDSAVYTTVAAALGRPGTYDVLIQKTGYRDWTASNVRARRGRCTVETVRLRAALVPIP